MICPFCAHTNIEGADACENCLEPLRALDVPRSSATTGLVRLAMEDTIDQLEPVEIVTARPEEPGLDVVRRMKERGVGCALVFEGDALAGIFTARDALHKMCATESRARAAANLPIGELMTPKPETLKWSDSVAAALGRMAIGRYRHVPVVDENGGYQVVSIKQVLRYIEGKDW